MKRTSQGCRHCAGRPYGLMGDPPANEDPTKWHTMNAHTAAAYVITNDGGEGTHDLTFLYSAARSIGQATPAAVARARSAGTTWAAIGYALGVTRQAVQQKYDPNYAR